MSPPATQSLSCGLVSVIDIASAKVCWLGLFKAEFAKVETAKGVKKHVDPSVDEQCSKQ